MLNSSISPLQFLLHGVLSLPPPLPGRHRQSPTIEPPRQLKAHDHICCHLSPTRRFSVVDFTMHSRLSIFAMLLSIQFAVPKTPPAHWRPKLCRCCVVPSRARARPKMLSPLPSSAMPSAPS
ncbi:hypothetical protein M0R45_000309 [Rubus argutus]|uniref:Uncharacterized protein n=1 Tax=Rubus argutus TaxID=59490 RepID=A0AAW1VL34_RUBAR